MPVTKRAKQTIEHTKRVERLEQLISEFANIKHHVSDLMGKLEMTADVLHAEARGVSTATHKPLETLRNAGKLDTALALLECLAERPAYAEAALELASGSRIEVVVKCLPDEE